MPQGESGSGQTVTLGNFELQRRIGKGGMGSVFLARDLSLDRPVALKTLHRALAQDKHLVDRFQREARAAARLNHPNIVQVYSVGMDKGVPFFAMEYVDGVSLERILSSEGAMPWPRALMVASQVADAIQCAHQNGIIHRDIKPANILLDKQGRARVTDFGVAKLQQAHTQLTTENMFLGTLSYASPEQCGTGDITPASDLFSLGTMLYHMLAGRLPFDAPTSAGLVRKITLERHTPLAELIPSIPPSVAALVDGLLEKDLANRYASASDVITEINRIRNGQPIERDDTNRAIRELEEAVRVATLNLDKGPITPPSFTRYKARLPWAEIAGGIAAALLILIAFILIAQAWNRNRIKLPEETTPSTVSSAVHAAPTSPVTAEAPAPMILMNRFDGNHDHKLDQQEVPTQVWNRISAGDTNHDGVISSQELESVRNLPRGAVR